MNVFVIGTGQVGPCRPVLIKVSRRTQADSHNRGRAATQRLQSSECSRSARIAELTCVERPRTAISAADHASIAA